jgi:hypothetical protein
VAATDHAGGTRRQPLSASEVATSTAPVAANVVCREGQLGPDQCARHSRSGGRGRSMSSAAARRAPAVRASTQIGASAAAARRVRTPATAAETTTAAHTFGGEADLVGHPGPRQRPDHATCGGVDAELDDDLFTLKQPGRRTPHIDAQRVRRSPQPSG